MKVWGILVLALAASAICLTASATTVQAGPFSVSFETGTNGFAYQSLITSGPWNLGGVQFDHYMFQYGLNTIEIFETSDRRILNKDEFINVYMSAITESLAVAPTDIQVSNINGRVWAVASGKSTTPMPADALSSGHYVGCYISQPDLRTVYRVSTIVAYTNPNEFQSIISTIKAARGVPNLPGIQQ
jgi:hypothetical protein